MKRIFALALVMLMAFALAARTEMDDEQLIQQIDSYFTMTRDELIETLGPDFEEVAAGPEGVCDGYYYEELGLIFAYYPDDDTLEMIDCDEAFRINGVGAGSLLSEVVEALGESEIIETWVETPDHPAYMVRYILGNSDYRFLSFEKDGPVDIFYIISAIGMYEEGD